MYNFKKNAKLHLVEGSNRHLLEVYSDISASQTFDEQGYKTKTLHNLNSLHEGATISKAAPANFQFTSPILDISTTPILLTLGTSYSAGNINSFDLYVESDNVTYRIEKAVIETNTYNITKESILTVSISGSASKISRFTGTIPGTLVNIGAKNYAVVRGLRVSINSIELASVASLNVEVTNEVSWTPNSTIQESLAGNIIYPSSYVVSGRRVSGSITQFLTSENVATLTDTTTTNPIVIDVLSSTGQATPFLRFNLPSSVFTRRLNLDEVFTRVYDFRLNSNLTIVKPIYKGV